MKTLTMLGVMAAPFVIGGIAAANTEGGANLCAILFFCLLMIRESTKICMLLERRWQMFEQSPAFPPLVTPSMLGSETQPIRVRANDRQRDVYHRR